MSASALAVAPRAAENTLPQFDLSQVMRQVAKANPGWPLDRLSSAELEYRRFVSLAKEHRAKRLFPLPDADVVWHQHILNTRKYIEDCDSYLGHYLHHIPTGGATPEERELMASLYGSKFGIELELADCDLGCCDGCE